MVSKVDNIVKFSKAAVDNESTELDLHEPNTLAIRLVDLLGHLITPTKDGARLIIDNTDAPLSIEFLGSIGIISHQNLMISTPNGMTNLNPVDLATGELIDIHSIDEYSQQQKELLAIAPPPEEDHTCLMHESSVSNEELSKQVLKLTRLTETLLKHITITPELKEDLKCLE